jgi:hypothetical protein
LFLSWVVAVGAQTFPLVSFLVVETILPSPRQTHVSLSERRRVFEKRLKKIADGKEQEIDDCIPQRPTYTGNPAQIETRTGLHLASTMICGNESQHSQGSC